MKPTAVITSPSLLGGKPCTPGVLSDSYIKLVNVKNVEFCACTEPASKKQLVAIKPSMMPFLITPSLGQHDA
jgi:hypothetical protein